MKCNSPPAPLLKRRESTYPQHSLKRGRELTPASLEIEERELTPSPSQKKRRDEKGDGAVKEQIEKM